jgi:hypothetical protein
MKNEERELRYEERKKDGCEIEVNRIIRDRRGKKV